MRILCCALLLFQVAFGQNEQREIDSIKRILPQLKSDTIKANALLNISRLSLKLRSLKGQAYAHQALKLSKELNWQEGEARAYFLIGNGHVIDYKNEDGMRFLKKANSLTRDELFRSKIYFSMGAIYSDWSEYPKALDVYLKSLKIKESLGVDAKGQSMLMLNLGSLYLSLEKNKEALEYLNKALKHGQALGNKMMQAMVLRNIGVVYRNLNQPQKALEYMAQAGMIYKETGDVFNESQLLSDIALVYVDQKAYQKAIDYSKESLRLNKGENENIENTGFSLGVIGDAYLELAKTKGNNQRDLDSAAVYLQKAISMHKELGMMRSLLDDYTSLTTVQKLRGNFRDALASHELLLQYKDSIYNADNRETVKNLEDKRAIELRDKEIKINNLRLDAKEKQKWYLIAGLALLAIIGALLFWQGRNRKKHNEKLQSLNDELDQANKIKARFFSILNHDLRSPVYNLIHYLQLLKDSPELLDAELKQSIEAKNMAAAENLLQSMEDLLLWSKSQMERFRPEFEPVALAALFADVESHFAGAGIAFSVDLEDESLAFDTDRNYLLTILRNICGNAIKAMENTPNPKITLKARSQHGAKYIWVTDNGPGANEEAFRALYDANETLGIASGLGLHIIRDMAAAIGCTVSVDSKPGEGTRFILSFGRT